ncbi:MAG: methyl-accepting chemotaxis protein [Clostridia bacterium]|nr:methyl-accepting chemotaxis protein [Clostridia bacterium]
MAAAGPERHGAGGGPELRIPLFVKLLGGFLAMALLVLAGNLVILDRLDGAIGGYQRVVTHSDATLQLAEQLQGLQGDLQRFAVTYVLTRDTQVRAQVAPAEQSIRQVEGRLQGLVLSAAEESALAALEKADRAYEATVAGVLAQAEAAGADGAALVGTGSALYQQREAVKADVNRLVGLARSQAEARQRASEAAAAAARTTALAVTVAAALLALLFGLILSRALSAPVRAVAEAAARVAAGDLTAREIELRARDETGELALSFNRMLHNLRGLVSALRASSRDVRRLSGELALSSSEAAQATAQISQAVQQVAQAASQQAADSEEAGAAVAQVGQAVDQVARGAEWQAGQVETASRSLAQLMQQVDSVAREGEHVLEISQGALDATRQGASAIGAVLARFPEIRSGSNEAAETVRALGERSKRIGDIVQAVSEIADRTNLLALNAAIEAARAGEHGRGFSVVAQEIRSLAQQSARSTEEIASLLGSITAAVQEAVAIMETNSGRVEESTARIDEAGEALGRILRAVEGTVQAVGRMTEGTRRAAEEARSVSKAMEELSGTTEENASAAEEMAASAREVSSRVESLAATAQETAASAEEVSAAVEELEASSSTVQQRAQELARLAQALEEHVGRFRIDRQEGRAREEARSEPARRRAGATGSAAA